MKRCFVLLLILSACSETTRNGTGREGARPPVEPASPLGVEYPDPLAIVSRVTTHMEEGNWAAACEELSDFGRNGRPVPLVPGENVPKDFPEDAKEKMKPYFRHFRGLGRPWVKISYGNVKPIRNDPPTISVPIRWHYELDKVTPKEREVILHVWKKQVNREVTWEQFELEMRQEVARHRRLNDWPEWTFAWLDDRWRLYIGRPLK